MVAINNDQADIPSVNFAVQGSDLSAPGAARAQLYFKSGGLWYIMNGGTATPVGSDPITTQGDIIQGGAAGVSERLAIGTAYQVPQVNAGATALAYGPALTDWTAVVKQGNQTPTITAQVSKYLRIGPLVYLTSYITLGGAGQGAQAITVEGLPFTPANESQACEGSFIGYDAGFIIYAGSCRLLTGSPWQLFFLTNATGDSLGISPAWTLANTDRITFTLLYHTA